MNHTIFFVRYTNTLNTIKNSFSMWNRYYSKPPQKSVLCVFSVSVCMPLPLLFLLYYSLSFPSWITWVICSLPPSSIYISPKGIVWWEFFKFRCLCSGGNFSIQIISLKLLYECTILTWLVWDVNQVGHWNWNVNQFGH